MNRTFKLRCISALTIIAAFVAQSVAAQNIIVNSAATSGHTQTGSFVNTNLLGKGVSVFNVRFNGQSTITQHQIGTFDANGFTDLLLERGVLLTTGHINVAPGPNDSPGATQQIADHYTDTELNPLVAPYHVTSCATLDFDFVSLTNSISILYCFGSEEYEEYVGSSFNDVFAFFVTGTDPETGLTRTRNIAVIPYSVSAENPDGIAVSINNVNQNLNTQYYIPNTYDEGVQYDGYTRKMSAQATVVPCETYHMHISVCNVQDKNLDSGVFLDANSLSSPIDNLHIAVNERDTASYGHTATVPFTFDNNNYDRAAVSVLFGGTAVSGTDFVCTTSDGDTLTPVNRQFDVVDSGSLNINVATTSTDPKDLIVYLQTAYCPDHPDLVIHDTLHFVIIGDPRVSSPTVDASRLNIYPNPADDVLNIEAPAIRNVDIYNADGRLVISRKFNDIDCATINTASLAAGAYSLRVTTSASVISSEIIIK